MAWRCSQSIPAALAVSLAAGSAAGAISVTTTPASGPTFTLTPVGGKTRVILNTNVSTQPTTFLVRGASTDQIEQVIINATVGTQSTFVEIRGATAGTSIASVDSIDMKSSTSTCILQDLRTSGNVGPIRMNTIADMNVGGDVTGSITLEQRTGGGEASLIKGTVTGRIRGDVIVDHGAIYQLTAAGGLGTAATPVQVRTKLNIVKLTAKEIFASIDTRSNGDLGWIGLIETTNGPFVGLLNTRVIASTGGGAPAALIINGDLDADVLLGGGIANENNGNPVVNISGRFMPGRVFRIGTTLHTGAVFRVASAAGLQGQVIINANATTGLWNGSVTVAGPALSPVPMYLSASSPIGGGSVGHVPFHIHAADCWPAAGSVIGSGVPDPSNPIRLRYYGPITWSQGNPPLVIEASPVGSPGTWINQTSCFTIAREPGASPHPNVIAAYPARVLPGGYTYRVRPVVSGAAALLCDLGLATNPAVADDGNLYSFTVTGGCVGDADGNGVVAFGDISAVLSAWGTSGGQCLSTVDVNGDGVVNFGDITAVLSAFNRVCP